ncbi:DUF4192 domain-containing protein [Nocardiopsis kunsanensis]|uniref:DUF4192 domain-containing protein n=1 Tax=Nocardiopsis kunsanensis TaxID=141693 RepID=A0A919CKH7_9ACTN|nr:DUF4192 domain-containing protein [Nocardiopsis kunsanensis]GHD34137.1 hypothetical protein GCM10007147_39460 [Nocardiopsis kunsanensis]
MASHHARSPSDPSDPDDNPGGAGQNPGGAGSDPYSTVAGGAQDDGRRISLSSPNDVVATMPYLVGQPPEPGLVVLTLRGTAVHSVLCRDLGPNAPRERDPLSCAGPPVDSAVAEGADALIVVGYGTFDQVAGHVSGLVTAAGRRGLDVLEAFRVHAGRYWSQMCSRPGCCPPEGRALDPDRSTGPADAVLRGLVPRPPLRTVLEEVAQARRGLEPPGSLRPETVRAALADSEAEADGIRSSGPRALRRCGAAVVRGAVEAERTGTGPHGVDELVRLSVFLRERPVRDTVWAAITPETARTHLDLWSRVTRAAEGSDRAAPASLAAVAAWQLDELVLAQAALETALDADQHYSMALLMRQALNVGLPVQRWIDHLKGRPG